MLDAKSHAAFVAAMRAALGSSLFFESADAARLACLDFGREVEKRLNRKRRKEQAKAEERAACTNVWEDTEEIGCIEPLIGCIEPLQPLISMSQ